MRGTTVKKIKRFVQILIANTPQEQRTKTPEQMFEEVKSFWGQDPKVRKFVNLVVDGKLSPKDVEGF